jgi:transcriptional regulator with XRE-family HTH domain
MTPTLSDRVASVVRAEMARKRVGQEEIAARLGLSQASVSRRIRGVTPFELDELETVADLLGLPVTAFIEDAA